MSVWEERNFRLLFIGQTTSSFGNALVPVALAFAVLDLTGSASDLGEVLGAQATALLVFLLAGGVIADRMPRRALMLGADALRGGAQFVLGLLLITGHSSIPALAGLGALIGMAAAIFTPAAGGLLPALIKPEHLQQANALQQASSSAAGIAGPAVAGVCVATIGPGWAIMADAGTFFVSVIMLSLIQSYHVPRTESRNWLRDLHDGWKDFWGRHWFRDIVLGSVAYNLIYAVYSVLGPDVSRHYYGGAAAWAVVATATSAGSVVASLAATKFRPRFPLRLAVAASGVCFLAPLSFGALLPLPVIAAAGAISGGGLVIFASAWMTSVQKHVPEHMISRAVSYDWFASLVAYPVGLAIVGPVAAIAGTRLVLVAAAAILATETVVLLILPSVRHLSDMSADAAVNAADKPCEQ